MSDTVLLELKNVTKSFHGNTIINDLSITLKAGTVHALMGGNGAGKSTLMKGLFGVFSYDNGTVFLKGEPVSFTGPRDALMHGIAMVQQELNQATQRTVMENIWMGRYPKSGPFVSTKKMIEDTNRLMEKLGIDVDPQATLADLPPSQRQMVEIARAVSYDAKVVVFDEPTSSLSDTEVEKLFEIIRTLKDSGCGIFYISHKMSEILQISDEISVLRDGNLVATRPASEMDEATIIQMMVGREIGDVYPSGNAEIGDTLLKVNHLSTMYTQIDDVSFELKKGEVLGLAGLSGSGRTSVLEALFGLSTRSSGEIILNGKQVQNNSPREAKNNGFILVTEERLKNGIFRNQNLIVNTTIANLDAYKKGGTLLSSKEMVDDTKKIIEILKVKASSIEAPIANLSGGNQQKLIIGRWLLCKPTVYLLDEPTRGIDVAAKSEVYRLINELADKGHSVIISSSETPELLGICNRILVMSAGKLAGEVDASTATQKEIMELATKYL